MTMSRLTERLDGLPRERRQRVEDRARSLISEEMSLRDVRKALEQTQTSVAAKLGINQENVSRLEQRSDLLLSTLTSYVDAMGGRLSLVAEFPGRPPIALTGIAALGDEHPETAQRRPRLEGKKVAARDTYKYHLKRGNKVVHRGITNDLDRREAEHQDAFPGARIVKIGRRTTRDAALKWERDGGKRPRP